MEATEDKWAVGIHIVEEWENTFDTLLDYYNTKDLRAVLKAVFGYTKTAPKNKLLSIDELTKWMKPQLEPSFWKEFLWREQFEKEKKEYDNKRNTLFGPERQKRLEKYGGMISKREVVSGLIKELRTGEKEVRLIAFNFNHIIFFHTTIINICFHILGDSFLKKPLPKARACRILQVVATKAVYGWSNYCTHLSLLFPQAILP